MAETIIGVKREGDYEAGVDESGPQAELKEGQEGQEQEAAKEETPRELHRSVWKLAWPSVLTMVLQTFNSFIDRFFVGHLGSDALAAVGIGGQVLSVLFAVGMSISAGTTALVSRAKGADDSEEAKAGGEPVAVDWDYRRCCLRCCSLAAAADCGRPAACGPVGGGLMCSLFKLDAFGHSSAVFDADSERGSSWIERHGNATSGDDRSGFDPYRRRLRADFRPLWPAALGAVRRCSSTGDLSSCRRGALLRLFAADTGARLYHLPEAA